MAGHNRRLRKSIKNLTRRTNDFDEMVSKPTFKSTYGKDGAYRKPGSNRK